MFRADERIEPTVIPSIMAMADEAAVAEPAAESQPAAPSLTEAYAEKHSAIEVTKPKKRDESGRNTQLSEEENTARELAQSSETARRQKKNPSLSEAYEGIQPDEDADPFLGADNLPEALQDFDPDAVSAAMVRLGLEEADLDDPRWINALKDILESQADADPDVEEEEGAETETEEKPETEEKKPEEKPAALPVPKTVEEYVAGDPAKLEALNKHIEATYQRASAMSEPVMTDVFVTGLARALQTPPENLEMLKGVADVLQYGGYALVEAAVPKLLPALIDEYMNRNFYPMVEHFIPGLREGHAERTVQSIWGETLEQEEFSGKGLPKFGTPEFHEAAKSVHEKNPWLNDFDPKAPDGKQLPPLQAMRVRAAVTARLLVGERIDSKKQAQLITDAIAKGKKDAEGTNRRVSASRMLGRGKTAGEVGKRENDSRESLIDAWQRGGGGGAI